MTGLLALILKAKVHTSRKFIVQRSTVLPYEQEVWRPESPMVLNGITRYGTLLNGIDVLSD